MYDTSGSLPGPVLLDEKLADEMCEQVRSLMCNWSPQSNTSDYVCEFCGVRAMSNLDSPSHKPDCLGQRFLDACAR